MRELVLVRTKPDICCYFETPAKTPHETRFDKSG